MYFYYPYAYTRLQGCPAANQTCLPCPPRVCTTAHRVEAVGLQQFEEACTSRAPAWRRPVPQGTYLLAWAVLWYALPHTMSQRSRAPSGVSMPTKTTQQSDTLTNPYG